jgi:hypothetical protein
MGKPPRLRDLQRKTSTMRGHMRLEQGKQGKIEAKLWYTVYYLQGLTLYKD